ncbi:hypothetical protein H2201_007562 [Coniosporium apollinis]|uniref:FAD-binding domain-containing protein n=2 Tax=Coniosporium TaxID=2810619 RepID=A0ABQ9NJ17_9PEZI|nr:hypothetical protein H2199_002081 [Cladosporium sp. JES 115]KAJ9658912.1 hypothetical protein H2201_007562 [Coniosporium apollinis]
MGMAEDIKLWKLLYRPPTSSWTRGKVVLIGDAAHPMLPNQGQGGAQAIEDGAALGLLLSNLPDAREVPRRLKLFQEIRKTRAAAMQIFSNAGQDEAEKIQKEARAYVKGPIPKMKRYAINMAELVGKALEAAEAERTPEESEGLAGF